QVDAAYDLFEREGHAASPVRMRVCCAGEIRLLALAEHILELNEHQASPRAGEIGQNCATELGRIERLSILRKELALVLSRKKSFLDERVEQQLPVAAALHRSCLGGIGIRIEIKTPAPREVTSEPEPFEGRDVVRCCRSRRKG